MKSTTKHILALGVLCAVLTAVSAWYSVVYNESRFIAPMDLSTYTFRVQDLPMLLSGVLLTGYILFVVVLLFCKASRQKRQTARPQFTRTLDPKLGFLGLLGFLGFAGFWTYRASQTFFPFLFFMFFGFFGFFYEGKMSHTLADERYLENKLKAQSTANRIALSIIVLAALILGQGRLMGRAEFTLIALVIIISLAFALDLFLSEALLYYYDRVESEE